MNDRPSRSKEPRTSTTFVIEPRSRMPALTERAAAEPPARDEIDAHRVAVIVCHGMGQQVPFETVEDLARAIRRGMNHPDATILCEATRLEQRSQDGRRAEPVEVRRAQLDVSTPQGGLRRTDLYEAYWAPLTEGKVTLWEVCEFLLGAAWRGIAQRLTSGTFDRWMFARWVEFPVPIRTLFKLVAVFALLLALAVLNAALFATLGARLVGHAEGWPGPELFRALSSDLAFACIALIVVAAGVGVIPHALRFLGQAAASFAAWFVIYAGLAALGLAGIACAWHVLAGQLGQPIAGAALAPAIFGLQGPWYRIAIGVIWGLPALAALIVRWFLIEYVGDVVAYVSSYSVSRFAEIRAAIQEVAASVGAAVFGAVGPDGTTPIYSSVVLVGHSLGSVIAYDMLNHLILEDGLNDGRLKVLERTAAFVTFGSPLNKTAYIFRTQRGKQSELRETMSAAIQPLISSYANRTMPWVNLHSRNDWIGGPLQYYDTVPPDPADPARGVRNCEDREARTPLMAHVELWNGRALADVLIRAIGRLG